MHQISGRWRLGLALALLTAACWGVLPIALKLLLEGMDAYTVTWYRFATSVAVLGVFLAATRNLPSVRTLGRMGWTLMLVALVGLVGNYVLYLLALRHVSPSVNQTVIQLAPIFLLFGGLFIYKERFTVWQRAGFVTLVTGLMLFFNRRLPELADVSAGLGLGVLLLLIAALVWAGYALAQKSLLKTLSSQQILWILYIGAVALLLPVSELGQIASLSPLQWALLAFSCANTLVAYGAFAEAMEHWEVSRVSAVLSISPLFTLVGMWLVNWLAPGYLQPEGLNLLSIGGALLVVTGSALTALGGQKTGSTVPGLRYLRYFPRLK
ncbi:MAG TPA: DMT family transporter [Steroidobacteraceae bacterium]|nr:DMT family transporter [Steroidobacteraceae bacterium]